MQHGFKFFSLSHLRQTPSSDLTLGHQRQMTWSLAEDTREDLQRTRLAKSGTSDSVRLFGLSQSQAPEILYRNRKGERLTQVLPSEIAALQTFTQLFQLFSERG
jgi:hypothetical protein